MNGIVVIHGWDLELFLRSLGIALPSDIYKISVHQREDGVAFKVNEEMWTPTLGEALK